MTNSFLKKEAPWYWPALFAVLTILLACLLVYTLYERSSETKVESLESDFEIAEANLLGRLEAAAAFLNILAEDYSEKRLSKTVFSKRTLKYLDDHAEIISVARIGENGLRKWLEPEGVEHLRSEEIVHKPIQKVYAEMLETESTTYSAPFSSLAGKSAMAVAVPIISDFDVKGAFMVQINLEKFLFNSFKPKFLARYKVELIHRNNLVAHATDFKKQISKDGRNKLLSNDTRLELKITAYKTPVKAHVIVISALCALLSIFLAFTLWILGRDNHKRKSIQAELEKAKNAAEAANRAKSQLIANISHEIRTPLGAIQGYVELLSDFNQTDKEKRASIGSIKRNATNLLELINDFLDLSKIEAGLLEIEKMRFLLVPFITEIVENFKIGAKKKNISLSLSFDGPISEEIFSDPVRLRQILTNVIGNAVKFTEKGSVEVVAALTNSAERSSALKVRVKDSGIGMNEGQKQRLFVPFRQGDNSISRRFGGTGLGLSLSKKMATMLGGDVELLESSPNSGSVFEVTIDAGSLSDVRMITNVDCSGEVPTSPEQSPSDDNRLSGIKVLIAEDCKDNQIIYRSFLESSGAVVSHCDNGVLALEESSKGRFDVVLMDIQMPEMDGYETTEKLRAQGFKEPIIALTAHAMKGERERCLSVGCNDYLTKPIDSDTLVDTISFYVKADALPTAQKTDEPSLSSDQSKGGPIVSKFADNPRVRPVLDDFVNGLVRRVSDMKKATQSQDFEKVGRLAHQLKGTAGNYGFPQIAEFAGKLETDSKQAEPSFSSVCLSLERLEDLSKRAVLGLNVGQPR